MVTSGRVVNLKIVLPETMKRQVEVSVVAGPYTSASQFVQEAIAEKLQRQNGKKPDKALLTRLLLDSLKSGEPIPADDEYFEKKKRSLLRRAGKRHSK